MYDELIYLAAAYFHQDCPLDEHDPLGGVREYLAHEEPVTLSGLLGDLNEILRDGTTEDQIRDIWLQGGSVVYDPGMHGISSREWLNRIRSLVVASMESEAE